MPGIPEENRRKSRQKTASIQKWKPFRKSPSCHSRLSSIPLEVQHIHIIKKIHYCWFGSPVPEAVRQNVWKWKELNPDFEIIEWNESNIDVSLLNLAEDAWNRTNGFLGDVVRLQALVEHGGFYLDCDVELFQPLSRLPVDHRFTLKYMYDCALGTAFLYAPPQHPLCISLLRLHNEIRKEYWPVSNTIYTDYFINEVSEFLLNGKMAKRSGNLVSQGVFRAPAFIRSRGFPSTTAAAPGCREKPFLQPGPGILPPGQIAQAQDQYGPGSPQE